MGNGVLFDATLPSAGKDLKVWMLLGLPFGMACGAYTVGVMYLILAARKQMKKFRPMQQAALSALTTTTLASICYVVSKNSMDVGLLVWGDGSQSMTRLMSVKWQENLSGILISSLVFILFKTIAVACAVGAGGSGGIFAPILILGGTFGTAYGTALSLCVGDENSYWRLFAVMGYIRTIISRMEFVLVSTHQRRSSSSASTKTMHRVGM